jgi:hypothetical protein
MNKWGDIMNEHVELEVGIRDYYLLELVTRPGFRLYGFSLENLRTLRRIMDERGLEQVEELFKLSK